MSKLYNKVKANTPILLLRGPSFTVECAIRNNGISESKTFLAYWTNLRGPKF